MISKIQTDVNNYLHKEIFYQKARDAMYDVVKNLFCEGFSQIYIPGYIGWSPKEGSGIFDPINKINGLTKKYYFMNKELNVDIDYLEKYLDGTSILLVVNYFGFRDPNFEKIVTLAHERGCVVIEDNAHGFYTYHLSKKTESDYIFFSLHKMLPFSTGGSLIINTQKFKNFLFNDEKNMKCNPYSYDLYDIAQIRKNNFKKIYSLIENYSEFIKPLRSIDMIEDNVPQSFPIILLRGNRDKIYELMNDKGYGVVSLYHTMIEDICEGNHEDAIWVSKRILNLPLHQDVDNSKYKKMIDLLVSYIKETQ